MTWKAHLGKAIPPEELLSQTPFRWPKGATLFGLPSLYTAADFRLLPWVLGSLNCHFRVRFYNGLI